MLRIELPAFKDYVDLKDGEKTKRYVSLAELEDHFKDHIGPYNQLLEQVELTLDHVLEIKEKTLVDIQSTGIADREL